MLYFSLTKQTSNVANVPLKKEIITIMLMPYSRVWGVVLFFWAVSPILRNEYGI